MLEEAEEEQQENAQGRHDLRSSNVRRQGPAGLVVTMADLTGGEPSMVGSDGSITWLRPGFFRPDVRHLCR